MIYVTGDVHCPIDVAKLLGNFGDDLTKDDYLIVCGDMGLVWYGRDKDDEDWQNWFEKRNYTTLFVDGNHENHARLDEMPVEMWHGGKVHKLRPSVIHLMRGQVYHIDGKQFFTFGGASSHDIMYRTENVSWWRRELPDMFEYEEGLTNLDKVGWKVDYIITHCAPTSAQQQISMSFKSDKLTQYFDTLLDDLQFKQWFFGHYHTDISIENAKFRGLYDDIVLL